MEFLYATMLKIIRVKKLIVFDSGFILHAFLYLSVLCFKGISQLIAYIVMWCGNDWNYH